MRTSAAVAVAFGAASALPALAQGAPAGQGAPAAARPAQPVMPIIKFEAANPGQGGGDELAPPRRLAAAVLAGAGYTPRQVTDVGSFTGEFLEAFMDRFPTSHGQWTEPVENNRVNAVRRLGGYGERVTYRIGCPSRDLAAGCVPANTDVLITSWLSIHQNLDGIRRFYKEAAAIVPSGGWVINLDHVTFPDPAWGERMKAARGLAIPLGLAVKTEGPPVHHPDYRTPTLAEQLDAFHAAGITDVQVVWQRLDTVLMIGRKP
ncbi:hypothetical protein H7F51_12360 [Novosphingobium flavum]|uniref:Methyltransferase domain-containing protein n=1 Tax=Novosphingobium flavum TaxID=1778672 RepID=A0A7X1KME9_9SPHN|nr:hypothetical protein [Novosphingobium flavum]MBC2666313.1 hypothetical protein [Novosphingobium flavum]